jgi:hypothetical protein
MEAFGKENIMKKLLLIVSILTLTLLPIGCAQDLIRTNMDKLVGGYIADYRITLKSDPGLPFSGSYMVVTAVYDPQIQNPSFIYNMYDVEGEMPPEGYMDYVAHDAIAVVGSFQKRTGDETKLTVEIWAGAEPVGSGDTTDAYGMVMVGGVK